MIVSMHPRTRKKLNARSNRHMDVRVKIIKPLGFFDYIKLQKKAMCVISDSGTITEEASILHFPAVSIREVHERPEGMDEGALIMCGLDHYNVINAIKIVMDQHNNSIPIFRTVQDYVQDNVSQKIVRIIQSYVGYVNRVVWKKH